MPKIQFSCSNCQTKYSALPDQAGQQGLCKNCGAKITVPKSNHKHIVKGTKHTESNRKSERSLIQKLGDLEKRVDQLIEKGHQTQATRKRAENGGDYVENRPFSQFRAASLSFLEKTFGSKHQFTLEFREKVTQLSRDHGSIATTVSIEPRSWENHR